MKRKLSFLFLSALALPFFKEAYKMYINGVRETLTPASSDYEDVRSDPYLVLSSVFGDNALMSAINPLRKQWQFYILWSHFISILGFLLRMCRL